MLTRNQVLVLTVLAKDRERLVEGGADSVERTPASVARKLQGTIGTSSVNAAIDHLIRDGLVHEHYRAGRMADGRTMRPTHLIAITAEGLDALQAETDLVASLGS